MPRFHVIGFAENNGTSVRTIEARSPIAAARLCLEQYICKATSTQTLIDLEVFRWHRGDTTFPGAYPEWDPEHVSRVKQGRDSTCYHGTKYADGTYDMEAVV